MLKYPIIILIFVSFVYGQNEDANVLSNIEQTRCIQNGKCDYFENAETCNVDCSGEALGRQRGIEARKEIKVNIPNIDKISVDKNTHFKVKVLSVLFISLFLVFLVILYYWIHNKRIMPVKKSTTKKPIIKENNEEIYIKKPTLQRTEYLPKRPIRRV